MGNDSKNSKSENHTPEVFVGHEVHHLETETGQVKENRKNPRDKSKLHELGEFNRWTEFRICPRWVEALFHSRLNWL